MNYPFTHSILGNLPVLTYGIIPTEKPKLIPVLNWVLMPIYCEEVTTWLDSLTGLTYGSIFMSVVADIPFHIDDESAYLALVHRILIPATDNFVWEFILKDGTVETIVPVIGNIYLFNNMIPHRVVNTDGDKRMCILVNIYDDKIEEKLLILDNGSYHS